VGATDSRHGRALLRVPALAIACEGPKSRFTRRRHNGRPEVRGPFILAQPFPPRQRRYAERTRRVLPVRWRVSLARMIHNCPTRVNRPPEGGGRSFHRRGIREARPPRPRQMRLARAATCSRGPALAHAPIVSGSRTRPQRRLLTVITLRLLADEKNRVEHRRTAADPATRSLRERRAGSAGEDDSRATTRRFILRRAGINKASALQARGKGD